MDIDNNGYPVGYPAVGSTVEILASDERPYVPSQIGKLIAYDYSPDYLTAYAIIHMADGQTWECDPLRLFVRPE
jgi:hypothetical protein